MNLLGRGLEDLAMLFARRDVDRLAAAAWHLDAGLPRLDGAAGWIECELHRSVRGGDHQLLFGLVTAASRVELPPPVHAYRTFGTQSIPALAGAGVFQGLPAPSIRRSLPGTR